MVQQDSPALGVMLSFMKKHNGKRRALPEPTPHLADERVARFSLSYLEAFGYLPHAVAEWIDIKIEDLAKAVDAFQELFGLERTGTMSIPTVRAMESQRCGCPDIVRPRHFDYIQVRDTAAMNLPRWTKEGLTYRITDYLPKLDPHEVDRQIQLAFDAWAAFGNISIRPTTEKQADIVISHGSGPQSNFDGPGGTLAWACYPAGDNKQLMLKFDVDETWAMTPQERGVLFANVACHEIGHLLGLDHSRLPSALMAPYYNPNIGTPQQNDDVPRFQNRYGKRPEQPAVPVIVPPLLIAVEGAVTGISINGKKAF